MGCSFAGAAVANSAGHGLAALVPRVREGGPGLLHANGGNATEHAFEDHAATPPRRFVHLDCGDRLDLRPRRGLPPEEAPTGTVEAATVVHDRDGPTHLLVAVRTSDGARGLVTRTEPDMIEQALADGLTGSAL